MLREWNFSGTIGEEQSKVLSTLSPRHAIAYGQSLSCPTPVIIALNDRETLLKLSPVRQAALAVVMVPDVKDEKG